MTEPNPFEPPKLDPQRTKPPETPARIVYAACLGVMIFLAVHLAIVAIIVGMDIDFWFP
jgi:hypothetical protein